MFEKMFPTVETLNKDVFTDPAVLIIHCLTVKLPATIIFAHDSNFTATFTKSLVAHMFFDVA